ncbi:MAG: cupredoxin domain-containing protein [Deinococcus sp.]|nr:cupredoxin domain-containing protein [Deinococcus sp.]MCL5964883.1 cupredoxin domain-containing protein [Deinococcus sp.]
MKKLRSSKPVLRKTTAGLWLGGLTVLALALGLFLKPYFRTAQSGQGAVIRISMAGWEPNTLYAKAGQPITVNMVNLDNQFHTDGGGWHNFVAEDLSVAERVGPNQSKTFTFTPNKPGEFLFYCDICCGGKDNPFMRGKLVVNG